MTGPPAACFKPLYTRLGSSSQPTSSPQAVGGEHLDVCCAGLAPAKPKSNSRAELLASSKGVLTHQPTYRGTLTSSYRVDDQFILEAEFFGGSRFFERGRAGTALHCMYEVPSLQDGKKIVDTER